MDRCGAGKAGSWWGGPDRSRFHSAGSDPAPQPPERRPDQRPRAPSFTAGSRSKQTRKGRPFPSGKAPNTDGSRGFSAREAHLEWGRAQPADGIGERWRSLTPVLLGQT